MFPEGFVYGLLLLGVVLVFGSVRLALRYRRLPLHREHDRRSARGRAIFFGILGAAAVFVGAGLHLSLDVTETWELALLAVLLIASAGGQWLADRRHT